jgi:hypothetical protein
MLFSPFEATMFFVIAFHIVAIAIQWLFINKMNGKKKLKVIVFTSNKINHVYLQAGKQSKSKKK